MDYYAGKIVVVIGAAHGIGSAIATEYAKAGARVVLADIDEETQRRELATAVPSDVGIPDIGHNNAVLVRSGGILDLDVASLQLQMNVNICGYIRVVMGFVPEMIKRGSGQIVNTASPNGTLPAAIVAQNLLPHCLCKAAAISRSQSMPASLTSYGISVSVVFPDVTYTETVQSVSGSSSEAFHKGFGPFLNEQGQSAEVVGKNTVDGVRSREFFINTCPGFEDALVTYTNRSTIIDWVSGKDNVRPYLAGIGALEGSNLAPLLFREGVRVLRRKLTCMFNDAV
ncbi:short chain dehydrogenase [Fusarium subglutinans]|uniref:Short chain dehydrogenase n=1 Tax=Gibberella subglutinans TaxID=42677 RepID=A0A8H5UQK9_GIBSU|nr:short chain dehydrogenase [Fusarium subglutinans]KAF5594588.1 short chain dehydrogenase [Fusarium subglutinans]